MARARFAARYCHVVRQRWRFIVREAVLARRPSTYDLTCGAGRILLRHGTADVHTVIEVFDKDIYAFPPEVADGHDNDRIQHVLDLGGHIGTFQLLAGVRFPSAGGVSVEADPANAALLRACVEHNRAADSWQVVEAVAAPDTEPRCFAGGESSASRVVGDGAAVTTVLPAIDVFELFDGVDLLKMDIEGSEWAILRDPRFASSGPPLIVVECHEHFAPPGEDIGASAETLLLAAGYATRQVASGHPSVRMLWAWRS